MSKQNSTVFNSRGRLSQSDYALQTVSLSDPIVAIKTKSRVCIITRQNETDEDATSMGSSNLFVIDKSLGLAGCGLKTDLKIIVKRARKIAKNFSFVFGRQISANLLAVELSNIFQEFTYSGGVRPFALSIFVIGLDTEGPSLFQIIPDGNIFCIKANIIGKNAFQGKQYLTKRWNKDLSFEETVTTGFLCLKEATEGRLESSEINVAIIDANSSLKLLNRKEIKPIILNIDKLNK